MENQALPPQSPLQQPFYSPHDEKAGLNFWRIIAIVLLIVLIGIGAVYLFNTQSQKPIVTSSQQRSESQELRPTIPIQQPAVSPVSQSDELVDWEVLPSMGWRTYYDKALNYSLLYPSDWFLYPKGSSLQGSTFIINKEDKEFGKGFDERALPIDNANECSVSITAHALSDFRTNGVQTIWDLVIVFRGSQNLEKVQFNNNEAIFVKPDITSGEGTFYEAELWFPGKIADLVYYIKMSSDPNIKDNCRKYFNTMVKSYQ